ncbi:MAG TPA: SDR family oxidoreductase [Streptosporangiaceae bacterium]|jgi:3-oxoacyl-[acyl-carrier protein] reductase|nr:SDR family oxidoreductase [Streptosporangiaceae bacterium]
MSDVNERSGSGLVVLITGASRGIGAETARQLSKQPGGRIAVNYREKQRRADRVVADIVSGGGEAIAVQADLTRPAEVSQMLATIKTEWGRIDRLILNASGGMERDVDPGYALRLNRDAQVNLVSGALELMPAGSRIVFVTSHQAHFHGDQPSISAYEPVALSKRAGEDALRARIPELTERSVDLVIVSGDMIEGTTTVMLLERAVPGIVDTRRDQVGDIPTVEEFAAAVASAAVTAHPTGHTIYVGGGDYLPR